MNKPFDNGRSESNRPSVTEEEIMAYADGLLAPERRAIVREALAEDPAKMRSLESHLLTHALRSAFDPVLAEPLPDRLLARLRTSAAKATQGGRIAALLRAVTGVHLLARYRMPMLAMAALCLMLLGAWLGNYALRYLAPAPLEFATLGERGWVAVPRLQRALASTPSDEVAEIDKRLAIRPTATLRTGQGAWCREFDLIYSSGRRGRSLACRSGDGTWLVPVTTVPQGSPYEIAGEEPTNEPSDKSPASKKPPPANDGTARFNDSAALFDGARQGIVANRGAVDPKNEKQLIERGWR